MEFDKRVEQNALKSTPKIMTAKWKWPFLEAAQSSFCVRGKGYRAVSTHRYRYRLRWGNIENKDFPPNIAAPAPQAFRKPEKKKWRAKDHLLFRQANSTSLLPTLKCSAKKSLTNTKIS
ncbi:hypothetical protein CDAR_434761 [Caerostris darwini]|uniref:Uncharacterized protein n=1 Tax=Caerostris darwini TaxID=1538125 RepID=A0AAV4QEY0_9ARAC|nr:hypothetical protein CDAR_434761 [Caerostris darwini]